MKTNDTVRSKDGKSWRVVASFSDGQAMIERFRGRLATDAADVFGALITMIVTQGELTITKRADQWR